MRARVLAALVLAHGCGGPEEYVPATGGSTTGAEDSTTSDAPNVETGADSSSTGSSATTGSSSPDTSGSTGETTGTEGSTTASSSTASSSTSGDTTTSTDATTTDGTTTTSSETTTSTETTTSGGTSTESSSTSGETTTSTETTTSGESSSSSEDGSSSSSEGSEGESSSTGDGIPDPIYEEHFDGIDGSPWPAPWEIASDWVIDAELEAGTGRLSGQMGFVGRMVLPGFSVVDVDATFVLTFDDPDHQGAGLYVRQNGGVLTETMPFGEGYEIYLEGDVVDTLAVWREVNGLEQHVASVMNPIPGGLQPGVRYALRLQCVQNGPVTDLRVKVWHEDEAEPPGWMLEVADPTASLQNAAGSFAVDVYNYFQTNSVYFDDVVITAPE